MSQRNDEFYILDDRPFEGTYAPSDIDPRYATTVAGRDLMIRERRAAGLSDFPAEPLEPMLKPNFHPAATRVAAD